MGYSSELRQAIAGVVAALPGWTVSRWAPSLFGRDADHRQHHTFAIDLPEWTALPGRQVAALGLEGTTAVDLLWAHRLVGDNQVASGDEALDDEHVLVGAVLEMAPAHISVERAARRSVAEGWILGTIRFRAVDRYPLTRRG